MLVDAHTHLDHYDEPRLAEALHQIEQQRVLTVAVATDPASWERTSALARQSPWIVPAFGIHPWKAAQYVEQLETLRPLIERSPMLGEIGLDFHWVEDRSAAEAQRRVLLFFLDAARERRTVVNLHTKGAEAEILALLDHYRVERAIIHWYSGPLDVARRLADRGAFFTVGVEVEHSPMIAELARTLPLDLLLTETDGPTGLEWLTGEIGMPVHIGGVVRALARLRDLDDAAMRRVIWANTRRVFADDSRLAPWARLMDAEMARWGGNA